MDGPQARDWRLLTRGTVAFAWFVVIAAFIHPAHGMGIPLCYVRRLSGVRCPGCGLSRSISCFVRGDVPESLAYHPLGLLVFALCAAVAAMSLLRRPTRLGAEPRAFRIAFAGFAILFILVGTGRALIDLYWIYVQ